MFFVGLDLGQRQDYTALVVVERRELWQGFCPPGFDSVAVRHVERMALGTPYTTVVERVRDVVKNPVLLDRCYLTVDATGVGQPVVDMIRAENLGCSLNAVTITGGDRESSNGSGYNVPKADLLCGIRVLLEKGDLRIARDLRGGPMLMRELRFMQAKGGAHGEHDDLVMALALACWRAKRPVGIEGRGRLPGQGTASSEKGKLRFG